MIGRSRRLIETEEFVAKHNTVSSSEEDEKN